MNRKEAIDRSILKWEILAETGEHRRYIKDITSDEMPHGCSLCQLAGQDQFSFTGISRYRCRRYCPYAQKFRCCCNRGQPFRKWEEGRLKDDPDTVGRRKHYASEFLQQLKQLD